MQSFRRNVIGAVLEAAIGYCMWCECVKSYSKIQKTEKSGIEFNFHTFFHLKNGLQFIACTRKLVQVHGGSSDIVYGHFTHIT